MRRRCYKDIQYSDGRNNQQVGHQEPPDYRPDQNENTPVLDLIYELPCSFQFHSYIFILVSNIDRRAC